MTPPNPRHILTLAVLLLAKETLGRTTHAPELHKQHVDNEAGRDRDKLERVEGRGEREQEEDEADGKAVGEAVGFADADAGGAVFVDVAYWGEWGG